MQALDVGRGDGGRGGGGGEDLSACEKKHERKWFRSRENVWCYVRVRLKGCLRACLRVHLRVRVHVHGCAHMR